MDLYAWTPDLDKRIVLRDNSYICNSERITNEYSVQYNIPPNIEHFALRAIYNNEYDNYFKQGKAMIDIGACYGVYSIEFVKHGLCTNSYAFEPNKIFYSQACINSVLNNVSDKINFYNNFVSDSVKSIMYNGWMSRENTDFCDPDILSSQVCETTYTNNHDYTSITSVKIDDFNFTNIGFIKIDTEGHELEVLRGAIKTIINNDYPPILFEMWAEDADVICINRTPEQSVKLHEHNIKLIASLEMLGYSIDYDVNYDKITHFAHHN